MLVLCLLLLALGAFQQSGTVSLSYLLKRQGEEVQASCISEDAERYAGVAWIYPFPEELEDLPNITTKYIPTIQSDFNCKFSKNQLCNSRWYIRNWYFAENLTKNTEYLADNRWEDLPTLRVSSNHKAEPIELLQVNGTLQQAFSLRASGDTQIFLCSGWDLSHYPCYQIDVQDKFIGLKKSNSSEDKYLDEYSTYSKILNPNEWRSFEIAFKNNQFTLKDLNLKRTVLIYDDSSPIELLYLFLKSNETSLWKVHQNRFLYSKTPQISRLGPQVTIHSKNLCINLYVATCSTCEMTFFLQNGTQKTILKQVPPTNNTWINIKLKKENLMSSKLIVFFNTQLAGGSLVGQHEGFWALDDVRLCNENEVKLTYLKLHKNQVEEDLLSCQLVNKPNWRPKKLIFNQIQDFPEVKVSSNSTSITLSWPQEDLENRLNYFVSYQGLDLCQSEPHNLDRLNSNGFLMTKFNEIVIPNLVSYTNYNLTISTVLHEKDILLKGNTLETEVPKLEELPINVEIQPADKQVYISWEPSSCLKTFGHILYSLILRNDDLKYEKIIEGRPETRYTIKDLLPFTKYNLEIYTARSLKQLKNKTGSAMLPISFTTLAGLANPVVNLEAYSINETSASLRFDLPLNTLGDPEQVQTTRCNRLSFKKCKSQISSLEPCVLWPQKYCLQVKYLIPQQSYSLKVSLKNRNTNVFGAEAFVNVFVETRAPGAPTNVSFKMVNCSESTSFCHLNLTWLHPYYENSTIKYFDVIVNSTKDTYHVVHYVEEYQRNYTEKIKFVPYSTEFDVYIQSVNDKFKSTKAFTKIKTDDVGRHLDQKPLLLNDEHSSRTYQLPILARSLDYYRVVVVLQDFNNKIEVSKDLKLKNLCHNFGKTSVIFNATVTTTKERSFKLDDLQANTSYCITTNYLNNYKGIEYAKTEYLKFTTSNFDVVSLLNKTSTFSPFNALYGLVALLILVPAGYFIYKYIKARRRRQARRQATNNENIYESLPFEECDNNFVNNINYDQLVHK